MGGILGLGASQNSPSSVGSPRPSAHRLRANGFLAYRSQAGVQHRALVARIEQAAAEVQRGAEQSRQADALKRCARAPIVPEVGDRRARMPR
jgi:hypothetical protein